MDRSLVRESNPTLHRYIMPISQDLIYMALGGKTKTAKHNLAQHYLAQDNTIK